MTFNPFKSLFSSPENSASRPQNIAAATAVQLHADADTIFVDVRGPHEITATGTIRGAVRAPLPDFARHADPTGASSLPAADSGKTIVLVCASGMRSATAARQLAGLGYPDVANIAGGIGNWKQAGGAMEP